MGDFLNVGKSLKDSRWVFPAVEQDIVARISGINVDRAEAASAVRSAIAAA